MAGPMNQEVHKLHKLFKPDPLASDQKLSEGGGGGGGASHHTPSCFVQQKRAISERLVPSSPYATFSLPKSQPTCVLKTM